MKTGGYLQAVAVFIFEERSPPYLLIRRLGGLQSTSERIGEEKKCNQCNPSVDESVLLTDLQASHTIHWKLTELYFSGIYQHQPERTVENDKIPSGRQPVLRKNSNAIPQI
jgi:hypothetical protein